MSSAVNHVAQTSSHAIAATRHTSILATNLGPTLMTTETNRFLQTTAASAVSWTGTTGAVSAGPTASISVLAICLRRSTPREDAMEQPMRTSSQLERESSSLCKLCLRQTLTSYPHLGHTLCWLEGATPNAYLTRVVRLAGTKRTSVTITFAQKRPSWGRAIVRTWTRAVGLRMVGWLPGVISAESMQLSFAKQHEMKND
jgi:hypothetical protein